MTFASGLPRSAPEIAQDAAVREKRTRTAIARLTACPSGQRYNREATEISRKLDARRLGEVDASGESR